MPRLAAYTLIAFRRPGGDGGAARLRERVAAARWAPPLPRLQAVTPGRDREAVGRGAGGAVRDRVTSIRRTTRPAAPSEACAFRDAFDRYGAAGVTIFGVSRDSEAATAPSARNTRCRSHGRRSVGRRAARLPRPPTASRAWRSACRSWSAPTARSRASGPTSIRASTRPTCSPRSTRSRAAKGARSACSAASPSKTSPPLPCSSSWRSARRCCCTLAPSFSRMRVTR